ncbi:MAG: NADH:ubiquinone reductase (Na(+)-transporting) subunit D [Bacteroidetes bacterium]|nr:NADH:ubiquinone reductase (Na(+)-transporting) subunit D [Bacteroidota bacterium]
MSEAAVQSLEKKEGLFSKKNRRLVTDPFSDNNPITVQVLGICSALAVTSKVDKAIVMSVAVVAVAALANVTISSLRKLIPPQIRMIVQLVVIASLVTLVREVLHAFSFNMYKDLSVYIGLIITNCIVMGRLEAFAMANKPYQSLLDGLGNGLGYGAILIAVAFFRELFGMGTVMGWPVMEYVFVGVNWVRDLFGAAAHISYVPNGVMVMPAAAMFLIGIFIWIQRSMNEELVDIS